MRRKPAAAALIAVSGLATLVLIGVLTVSVVLISQALRAERRTAYFQRIGRAHSEWQAGNPDRADRLLAECPTEYRGWEWNYLYHLCHAEQWTYTGHADVKRSFTITALAFSPDGRRVGSLDSVGHVKIWGPDTGEEIASWLLDDVFNPFIDVAAFSPDLRHLASFSPMHSDRVVGDAIRVWDLTTGKQVLALKGQSISVVAFSPDGKYLASARTADEFGIFLEQVKLWDLATGAEVRTVVSRRGTFEAARSVHCLAFSPDGKRLATGGHFPHDPAVRVWDVGSGKELAVLPVDRDVLAVAYSPDGKRLAASCGSTLRAWDTASGKELYTQPGAGSRLVFSADGRWLASNGPGSTVVVREAASGAEVVRLPSSSRCLAFSPDGKRLAADYRQPSPRSSQLIKIWDPHVNPEARTLCRTLQSHPPLKIAFSSDSRWVAVADLYRLVPDPNGPNKQGRSSVGVFDSQSGEELFHVLDTPGADAQSYRLIDAAFSPDRSRLAVLGINEKGCRIQIVDVQTKQALVTFRRPRGWLGQEPTIAYGADGRLVLGLCREGSSRYVEVCEADSGLSSFLVEDEAKQRTTLLALTRDGRRLATVYTDVGWVQLWDTVSGRLLGVLNGKVENWGVRGIALSGDGHRLAVVGPNSVATYDTGSGKELLRFRPGMDCGVVAFSPDSKRLATGSDTGIITLWDAESGQEVLTLRGHSGGIVRLTFSADGRFLASSSGDGSVKLWEAATPRHRESE